MTADGARRAWLDRVDRARQQYQEWLRTAQLGHDTGSTAQADPLAHLSDSTLQPGDVVVTQAGLFVFRGSSQFPYSQSDFAKLGEQASIRTTHRRELLEIDRVRRSDVVR